MDTLLRGRGSNAPKANYDAPNSRIGGMDSSGQGGYEMPRMSLGPVYESVIEPLDGAAESSSEAGVQGLSSSEML